MTSNVGSRWIEELTKSSEIKEKVREALRSEFRPEFLNRIDEIIIFNRLGREEIKKIVDIQFRQLRTRLNEKKIRIFLTDKAKEFIAEKGFDPVYGARPLKRTIQREILDPLAIKLLEGEFKEGDEVIVNNVNGKIVFQRK